MHRSKIEWCRNPDGSLGWVWNPITGCLNGCEYCYARKLANTRLKDRYLANDVVADISNRLRDANSPLWDRVATDPFYPRFWEDRLEELNAKQKPRGIFVCDMSDLFGKGIPEKWTWRIINLMTYCSQHRFYLLTKQPQNLIKFSPFPPNVYLGVSATNQEQFDNAVKYLKEIKASVKYLSIEPFLEWQDDGYQQRRLEEAGIKQVIIGAQTKPYKPPKIEWVQEIVEACDMAGIPVFLKNNLWDLLYANAWDNDIFWANDKATLRQEMPCK